PAPILFPVPEAATWPYGLIRAGMSGLGGAVSGCSSPFIPRCGPGLRAASRAAPTEPQAAGWREIAAGRHTLIAAPTGSGKTLAAFLVCIDRLYRAHERACPHDLYCGHDAAGARPDGPAEGPRIGSPPGTGPQVVYVSPLKALATDIQLNLEAPLREITALAAQLGLSAPAIRVAVRTGDTAAAERAAMLQHPPDILITTPESLYLLVTAERSRSMLRSTTTVIVDEIHAVASNKRGSHLA